MAGSIRSLLQLNTRLISKLFLRNTVVNAVSHRFLYTPNSLGINGYESQRITYYNQFANVHDTFRAKMLGVCENDQAMIFTEDLKAMLHLAHKIPEDLELTLQMIKKFHKQNKEIRFGTFIFGPVVMRMFYYMDEPDQALATFNDPELQDFFDQIVTCQILLSLLYKHGKYADMRKVYDCIQEKQFNGKQHPRNPLVLVLAGCYKENTKETFEYAQNLWMSVIKSGDYLARRPSTFVAALALKQNAPHVALECISSVKQSRYIDVRCVKILAFAALEKYTEIIPVLRASLEHDRPASRKESYFKDVINQLESQIGEANNSEAAEVQKYINLLKQNEHILDINMEQNILKEIDITRRYGPPQVQLMNSRMRNKRPIQPFSFSNPAYSNRF